MASFKWSTPGRCVGTKELPLIPNEVYLDIFEYIQPSDEMGVPEYKRILSNLALVCRFFSAVLLPRIFKSLNFSGLHNNNSDTPGYASFCRALIRKKEPALSLALHVRECTFSQWSTLGSHLKWVLDGFLGLYNQAITGMPNLESLTLVRTPISRKLIQTMSKFTKLKILVMDDSPIDSDVTNLDISKLSSLMLATLEFRERDVVCDCDLLELITPALRVFRTNSWPFARDFMMQEVQCHIEELEVEVVEDIILLRDFLERTPSITKLNISRIISEHTRLGLSSSSLPRLHSIDCPSSVILDFVPSRPLKSVALSGTHYLGRVELSYSEAFLPPMTPDDVALVAKSAVAIRTLDIPAVFYSIAPIGHHFPHLDKLRLDFMYKDLDHHHHLTKRPGLDTIAALCNVWTTTPPIHELELHFDPKEQDGFFWDLELQHHIIVSNIMVAFPAVVRLTFVEFVEWRKGGNGWRAFVPHSYHMRVQTHLVIARWGFKDYNGCFAALLPWRT